KIPYLGSGSLSMNLVVNTTALTAQIELTTGMLEPEEKEGIKIYPNPVLDKLYVQGLDGQALARIYDIHGRLLLTIPVDGPSAEIDMRELRTGVFLISFETALGTVTRRFLKHQSQR
ncbi:MAG: T9SS type A sorting domain-containing protein, partial [Bacteroidales bacterium]|nr:T9SS type A sorting domain-containing protein [Bacteroidales bacterium]